MHLFDDIERTYRGPAPHVEGTFSFLNRSAWPASENVRTLLESLFSQYPADERRELKIKFQTQFDSAFFELLLHGYFLRLGCDVRVHPALKGTQARPDFLVRFDNGKEVFVEAVVSTDRTDKERARDARLHALYDSINDRTFSPNFFICLGQIPDKEAIPSPKKIRKFIEERIAGLDPDAVANAVRHGFEAPRWTYKDERGFELEITVAPKTPEARGDPSIRTLGAFPGETRWGDSRISLKKSLDGKATKYGAVEAPFIIAVNAVSAWGAGREVVLKALYGSTEPGDESEGFWNPTRNRRVSAVLVATLYPWNLHCAPVCLHHNSFAKQPCQELPSQIPQATPSANGMQWAEGTALKELFSLPPDWPGAQSEG